MLRLRVVCPPEQSEQVRQVLIDEPGASHLVVLPGAAVRPRGDVIEAVLTRECVDGLLARLADLGLARTGGMTLEVLDAVVSEAAEQAEEAAPGEPADAVIWDELIERSGEESRLTVSFLAFLTIACLLAAIGAITNSPVTVVGAMVLGPEFGPLAALAVGVVLRRGDLLKRAGFALAVSFPVAMVITALAGLVFNLTGLLVPMDVESLPGVDFVYEVGPFSMIIALLAGAAGMLSLTTAKSSALVGVFISVTTVPAAAFAAVAALVGRWDRALSSTIQLLVNLVGIVLAGAIVLWLSPSGRKRRMVGKRRSAG